MSVASSSSSSSASSSSSGSAARSAEPAHVQQLALLQEFVKANQKLYESFRYEPWTTKPNHAAGISLRPSELIAGTLGVHVKGSPKGFVCNYPGALMWEELHETFNEHSHCPTAVRVSVLDYLVDAQTAGTLRLSKKETKQKDGQFLVRVMLVGDPCAVGPLINSPRGLAKPPNCDLETCAANRIDRHLKKLANGRISVESNFLAVHRNSAVLPPSVTNELLLLYSDEFWSRLDDPVSFCDQCCRKDERELITCTGNSCRTSRHARCGAKRNKLGLWHCPRHANSQPIPILDSSAFLMRTPPPAEQVRTSSAPEAAPANLASRLNNSAQPAAAAATRLPRQSKDRAIAALKQGEFESNPPTHNLPPGPGSSSPSAHVAQVYYPSSSWQGGLEFNCHALSLSHRPSSLKDADDGLFLGKPTPRDGLIGYFFGHFIPKQDNMTFVEQGPNYSGLRNIPIEQAQQAQRGVWWSFYAQGVEDAGNEYVCIVDRQCPMGYANDPRDSSRVNCAVRYPSQVIQNVDGSLPYFIFPVYATRDISANSELFVDYNWSDADWALSAKLRVTALELASRASYTAASARYASYAMDAGQRTPPPGSSSSSSSSSSKSLASTTPSSLNSRLDAIDQPQRSKFTESSGLSLDADFELGADERINDSEPDDSNDSDPDDSVRSALTRRISAEVPRRQAPQLVIPKATVADIQLSDDVKRQLRQQWLDCEEACKRAKVKNPRSKARSASSSSSSSSSSSLTTVSSKADDSRIARLLSAWTTITLCCATFMKLKAHINIDNHAFQSPLTLNAARLRMSKTFKHQKALLKAHLREQLKTNQRGAKFWWEGLPLCLSCYVYAIGWSRRTVYRAFAHVEVDLARVEHQTAFTLRGVTHDLASLAMQEGQTNPLGDAKPGQTLLVLQYTTREECRMRLEDINAERNGFRTAISESTFGRAIELLSSMYRIDINIKKGKKLAKCATCEELQNLLNDARKRGNATDIEVARRLVDEHNSEWMEQRFHFEEKKKEALQRPWLLNVATLDGMDTAKTNLPHFHRFSKHSDAELCLPIRVVGAFYFGGPVPCMGMTSFEDVPSKGAAPSATAIETMINLQYEAMDENNIAPIPTEQEQINAARSGKQPAPMPDEIEVESAQWRENEAKLPLVPFMWPEGLHLTFDNTSGDCKNAGTFRFLGLLVALGVFCYISVSTLLVGHTHDIVDQMFSVWSRQLGSTNATTLEELHTLFRNKYSSKIYVIERLKKAVQKARQKSSSCSDEKTQLSDRVLELCSELRLRPHLVLQTFCIDESWIFKGPTSTQIKMISKPHIFYIVQESVEFDQTDGSKKKEEVIVMYTRFLACSYQDQEFKHKYEFEGNNKSKPIRGGPYTSRVVLLKLSEVPQDDPNRQPPMPVNTDDISKCLLQHKKEKNMNQAQLNQFQERLDRFSEVGEQFDRGCARCKSFMDKILAIGTISRKVDATEAQLDFANEQTALKTKLRKELRAHLFNEKHDGLKLKGWWGKWRERVARVIRPYYLSRQLIVDLKPHHATLSGRSAHPRELPCERSDPPICRLRVDEIREKKQGLPKVGHLVVTRGATAIQPMWIGKVLECYDADGMIIDEDEEYCEEPRSRGQPSQGAAASAAEHSAAAAAAVAAPALRSAPVRSTRSSRAAQYNEESDIEEEELEADSEYEEEQAPPDETPVSMSMTEDEDVLQPTAKQSKGKRKSADLKKKASISKKAAIVASASGSKQSQRKVRRGATAAAASSSSSSAAAASASSSSSSSAAAAAASSSSSSSVRDADAAANFPAESGPRWKVHWYQFKDNSTAKQIMPIDENRIEEFMLKQSPADQKLWLESKALFARGLFGRLPQSLLTRCQNLSYLPMFDKKKKNNPVTGFIIRSQLIAWGSKVLLKDCQLSKDAWDDAIEDLCETQDVAIGVAIDYAAEAAAGEAQPRTDDESKHPEP